jgi:2-dehydro-3-deoxyphosphogluconate aldolase/(4S)-4-hydroxy-2-oxoglutarate aldolase
MVTINNSDLQTRVSSGKLVTIIRTADADSAVAAARTLLESGIKVLEIALTVQDATKAIEQVSSFAPRDALIGAGTVLTKKDVDDCVAAGAQFIVTPALTESVDYALANDIGVLAGAFSPTEIQKAMNSGVAAVKLFPATSLGTGYIQSLLEPFPNFRLIPVGGVNLTNIKDFLRSGAIAVGVGGSLIGDAERNLGDHALLAQRAQLFLKEVNSYELG